jgi:hypothetical protein
MAEIVENERGAFIRDPLRGSWRRATDDELAELGKSGAQVAAESFWNNFAQLGNMAQWAIAPILGDRGQRAVQQDAVESMARRGQEQYVRGQVNPQATAQGTAASIILDPLNLALPAGGRMAERVAVKTGVKLGTRKLAARRAATPKGLNKLLDLVFEPGTLTPQQQALIPVGDRVGFKWLPGQKSGNRMFLDSLQSHPITAQAFAPELAANADRLKELLINSLGLKGQVSVDGFGKGILRLSRQTLGGKFDDFRNAIPEGELIGLSDDSIATIKEVPSNLSTSQRRLIKLEAMDGKQAFEVRSRLNKKVSELYRRGEATAADDLLDAMEELDDAIGQKLGPEKVEAWRTTRQQWRVRIATKKPNVITGDGDVSLKRLTAELERSFEREFGETLIPDEAFRKANPEIADLMDFTRVARSFASNLPDSGTATRQTIGRILQGDWSELAAAQGVRQLIRLTAK